MFLRNPANPIILLTLMITTVLAPTLAADAHPFAGGNGTSAAPYRISAAVQLDSVRRYLDAHFVLVNNINLGPYLAEGGGGYAQWNERGWMPIGSNSKHFTGNFDGGKFSISNLKIDRPEDDYIGLFGYIDSAAVSNLRIASGEVKGRYDVGGICGLNWNGVITGCSNKANVTGDFNVGGVCGTNRGESKNYYEPEITAELVACYNDGTISCSIMNAGGVCGMNRCDSYNGRAIITSCYNNGVIRGDGVIGGVCGMSTGYCGSTQIDDCYNKGKVTGRSSIGDVCGCDSICFVY
ncbi:MAG: hypothetical protein LBT35_07015 [Tannerella sp.]|jgi:hypothetical protein|nr:hypothetical protein [Tannerella sp.]